MMSIANHGRWMALGAVFVAAEAQAALSLNPISDTVVDANALIFGTNGEWGRGINGQAFQADALVTFGGYQYVTWYHYSSGDKNVMIARRTINGETTGPWETVNTGSRIVNGLGSADVHNTISMGISANDGVIHLAFDHHVNNLRYEVSPAGLATTNKNLWGPTIYSTPERNYLVAPGSTISQVTYPMYFNTPSGDLQFAYRTGTSGNGTMMLSNYTSGAGGSLGTWSTPRALLTGTGSYKGSASRNAYVNGFDYGPDGKLHLTWTWRELAGSANHDINYAYSEDGGTTWKNNAGTVVANLAANDPLNISDPGLVVVALDDKQSLYNQMTQGVDSAGRVHTIVEHRRQEPGYEWRSSDPIWDPERSAYYHYFRDPATGEWSQRQLPTETGVGSRARMAIDADGNVYAVYTDRGPEDGNYKYNPGNLIISAATAASNYTDWSILYQGTEQFIGEPFIDKTRLLEDGILSIMVQLDSPGTTMTGTPLRIMEFAAVPEPTSASLLVLTLATALTHRRRRTL
jgi:hypothetical protein